MTLLQIDRDTGEIVTVWRDVERLDVGKRFIHAHSTKYGCRAFDREGYVFQLVEV